MPGLHRRCAQRLPFRKLIAGTGIPGGQQAVAYLVFALIATLGVGIPVGIYFAMASGPRSCSVR